MSASEHCEDRLVQHPLGQGSVPLVPRVPPPKDLEACHGRGRGTFLRTARVSLLLVCQKCMVSRVSRRRAILARALPCGDEGEEVLNSGYKNFASHQDLSCIPLLARGRELLPQSSGVFLNGLLTAGSRVGRFFTSTF